MHSAGGEDQYQSTNVVTLSSIMHEYERTDVVLSHFTQCVSLCLLQDMASSQGQCQLDNMCSGYSAKAYTSRALVRTL